jgi:hypothetical protein
MKETKMTKLASNIYNKEKTHERIGANTPNIVHS